MGDIVYKNRCAPHISEWCIKKFPIALFFFLCARKRYTQIFIYSLPLHFFCTIIKTFLFHFFLLVCSFPLHSFFCVENCVFCRTEFSTIQWPTSFLVYSLSTCFYTSIEKWIYSSNSSHFCNFFSSCTLIWFYMLNSAVCMSERWMLKIERLMFESVKK